MEKKSKTKEKFPDLIDLMTKNKEAIKTDKKKKYLKKKYNNK